MIYDGYDFSQLMKVEAVHRSLLPELSVETATIPGRDGSVFRSTSLGSLVLSVDVRLMTPVSGIENQKAAFESLRREVAGRLLKASPCDLVVDDAPDLTYTASLRGSTDLDRFVYTGGTTLEFLCMEPWGRGRTVKRTFVPSETGPGKMTVNVGGNVATAPVVVLKTSEANVSVEFDGIPFNVFAMAGAGDVTLDCELRKAYQNSVPVTVDINSDWPTWDPGVHSVMTPCESSVSWSERWI